MCGSTGHTEAGALTTELDVDQCLALLAANRVGRLAVDDGRGPVILPVNYLLHEGTLLFRTAHGTKLSAAGGSAGAAFEVDRVDEGTRTGSSVLVRGRLVEVVDGDELDALLQAVPTPFAEGDRQHVLQLLPTSITGRVLA